MYHIWLRYSCLTPVDRSDMSQQTICQNKGEVCICRVKLVKLSHNSIKERQKLHKKRQGLSTETAFLSISFHLIHWFRRNRMSKHWYLRGHKSLQQPRVCHEKGSPFPLWFTYFLTSFWLELPKAAQKKKKYLVLKAHLNFNRCWDFNFLRISLKVPLCLVWFGFEMKAEMKDKQQLWGTAVGALRCGS